MMLVEYLHKCLQVAHQTCREHALNRVLKHETRQRSLLT